MSLYQIIISPTAKEDLDVAFIWYEEQREGLGFEFITSFDATVQKIKRSPAFAGLIYKNVRGAALHKFPYEVLYITNETVVNVIAVIHHLRNPDFRNQKHAK